MRSRIFIIIYFILIPLCIYAQKKPNPDVYGIIQTDYLIASRWDALTSSWLNSTRQVYYYDENNRLVQLVTQDIQTNNPVSRVTYQYNTNGIMIAQYFQDWLPGMWIDKIRYLMDYNASGQMTSLTINLWKDNSWVYSARQYNIIYNESNQMVSYHNQNWTGTDWVSWSIDYFYYNANGKLNLRTRTDMLGINSYQIFYFYNADNLRTQMLVQTWQRTTNSWMDSHRDSYSYDLCGKRTQFLRERYRSGVWVNEQRSDYFFKLTFPPVKAKKKVILCHNNKSTFVPIDEINVHLAHGDCLGNCLNEQVAINQMASQSNTSDNLPVNIYPNPATDNITISFIDPADSDVKRIELMDIYGKPLKIFHIKEYSDLTINRDGWMDGIYYIKIIGKEVYYSIVVFE